MICEYGCGKQALFPPGHKYKKLTNKKWCCSETCRKCLGYISKHKILQKGNIKERFMKGFDKVPCQNLESIEKTRILYDINLEKECWIWKKATDRDGYGLSNDENNYPIQAHRHSYKLFVGNIPKYGVIAHHCDTPGCVNPNHLFLTTPKGNNKDRTLKNREARGLKNGMYTKPETRAYGNSSASSLWKVTFPDGNIKIIKNLTKLSRNTKIPYTTIRYSLRGWKVELIEKFTEKIKGESVNG